MQVSLAVILIHLIKIKIYYVDYQPNYIPSSQSSKKLIKYMDVASSFLLLLPDSENLISVNKRRKDSLEQNQCIACEVIKIRKILL